MMKKTRSKEMTGESASEKNKAEVHPSSAKKLICLRECEIPWVGYFKSGEIVEDASKIASIADNPNFEEVKTGGTKS